MCNKVQAWEAYPAAYKGKLHHHALTKVGKGECGLLKGKRILVRVVVGRNDVAADQPVLLSHM